MQELKPKIIFLGTPEFAVPSLLALIANGFKPVLAITQPDKPAGRKQELTPPPIKQAALQNEILVLQPPAKNDLAEIFLQYRPDLCVLVAYGSIIPKDCLNQPRGGFLNIHPSLLPKYRGSSPIQTAILNGEKETGVSIIQLVSQVDAGPIIAQKTMAIAETDNAETLSKKLAELGAELLIEILANYLAGRILPKPQDESKATFTAMISREDGQINWQKTAAEIQRQFRAFYPWPGVFTQISGQRLKIANLSVLEGNF
ncbi:MAG: methionyl-tRNA formyltransferase, partial [Patescibacteria group bacterium]